MKAKLGENVKVGQFTTIYVNVEIADNIVIEGYCEIGVQNHLSKGETLYIGENSHIRSHSAFYEGSTFLMVVRFEVDPLREVEAAFNVLKKTMSPLRGPCSTV